MGSVTGDGTSLIDACAFHEWPSSEAIAPYMSAGWREMLKPVDSERLATTRNFSRYTNPLGEKARDSHPEGGPPGSDLGLFGTQHLDELGADRVVLAYDEGIRATTLDPQLAREVVRAANTWSQETWLASDPRLHGLALISPAMPEEAAAEIRRAGACDRVVGVALGENAVGQPFGHPLYRPIYEAASELGLPVVLQTGTEFGSQLRTMPVAGGAPATYGEVRAFAAQPLMTHVTSMIVQGVFEEFRDLQLLVIGGGLLWIPAYLWRIDAWYKMVQHGLPWLSRRPSEYFLDHVSVATHSLEPLPAERLEPALMSVPELAGMLVYTSCYPNADGESPESVLARIPPDWHAGVRAQNAGRLFRWRASAEPEAVTGGRRAGGSGDGQV